MPCSVWFLMSSWTFLRFKCSLSLVSCLGDSLKLISFIYKQNNSDKTWVAFFKKGRESWYWRNSTMCRALTLHTTYPDSTLVSHLVPTCTAEVIPECRAGSGTSALPWYHPKTATKIIYRINSVLILSVRNEDNWEFFFLGGTILNMCESCRCRTFFFNYLRIICFHWCTVIQVLWSVFSWYSHIPLHNTTTKAIIIFGLTLIYC